MSKTFISFLGTNDYLECIYYIDGEDKKSQPLKYVQEYSVKKFSSNWDKNDKVLIFTTKTASEKNWVDNGHNKPSQGLGKRLELLNLTPETKNIMIPDGNSEDEIWEIFEKVFDELENGDEIIFDITHAFRSIPMLAIVILNYAKVLKNVSLSGIYYGAMEALGSFPVVKEIELEKRFVPIFELTAFDNLLDWSSAIERFTKSGDASRIKELASGKLNPVLRETRGKDKNAENLNKLADNLDIFSKSIITNREINGGISFAANGIKEKLSLIENTDIIPAFKPLLQKIELAVSEFGDEKIQNGFAAIKWCIEHSLIQQAYTLLFELIFTKIAILSELDASIKANRDLASFSLFYVKNNVAFDDWKKDSQENKDITEKMISIWQNYGEEFLVKIDKLQQIRNDINHATGQNKIKYIIDKLSEFYNYFKENL